MAATGNEVVKLSQLKMSIDSIDTSSSSIDAYPVGSIYMSVNSTSPATLFGGSWTQIQDRFLIAAGSTYKAGGTGGEATHKLTVNEMPSHRHTGTYNPASEGTFTRAGGATVALAATKQTYTGYSGGGSAHNNMPPTSRCMYGRERHK